MYNENISNGLSVSNDGVTITVSESPMDTGISLSDSKLVDLNLMGVGNHVDYGQVVNSQLRMPDATDTFYPIPHHELVDEMREQLRIFSMRTVQEAHLLDHEDQRYFGLFQIGGNDFHGVTTIMGLRNSHDMSISAGVCLGDAPFVCSNLCFNNEYKFNAKHTKNVWQTLRSRFRETMCQVIDDKAESIRRVERMKDRALTNAQGDSFIWNTVDQGALTLKQAHQAHLQWRNPEHNEFNERNVWSLQNGITNVLRGKIERDEDGNATSITPTNRHVHMTRTTKIRQLLDKEYHLVA
tara:strand:+ start:4037 stop:4924 length:888 start_codon:yes stop_codon:yes gene_type:complete